MTPWQPGMRCVCIDDTPGLKHAENFDFDLKKGSVYTVLNVKMGPSTGRVCLSLQEAPLYFIESNLAREPLFFSSRFRPLSETRLDQFRAHLAPVSRERVSA